ncbi:MAG: alpha/beta hydrolase [Firmicutes bacterium HGW-Firmicutes-16]|nr:MAG: alpha/beta hydrolase [Firmicutes bacterium HGW-Firmicutes-16]
MPILNEFSFNSCDCKSTIYVREWLPDTTPIGVIQICHGVAEHISRYDKFAQYLASNGFVVAGNDHLGHGKSVADPKYQGYFGEHGGWELVVGDMRKLYERLKERYFSLPIFILGHSMGSFLTRTYIIRYHDGPDGVILSGTGQQSSLLLNAGLAFANSIIKSHGTNYKSQFLHKLSFGSYNDRIKPNRTEVDWLTRENAIVDEYISDPDCGFVSSADLSRDMMMGLKYIASPKNLERMNKNLPVFFVSGDADPVGEYGKGVLRVYNGFLKAGLSDVTLKLYHDSRHEILNEQNKEEVYEDIRFWLQAKCRIKELESAEANK